MEFSTINFLATIAAAAASFLFGSLFYMSVARPWRDAVGKSEAEIKAIMRPPVFIRAGVAQLVLAITLALVLPSAPEIADSVILALILWFGIVMTTMAINHGFQGKSVKLTLIDGAHWLGVLLIQAIVLCLF